MIRVWVAAWCGLTVSRLYGRVWVLLDHSAVLLHHVLVPRHCPHVVAVLLLLLLVRVLLMVVVHVRLGFHW